MSEKNTHVEGYPDPKGDDKYNEFVSIIFKNNMAMLQSQSVLFEENRRLKEDYRELWELNKELLEKSEQLEKEANWLVDEIIMSESKKCPLCDCLQKVSDSPIESESIAFLNGCRKCWREAAREAVEKQNERK